MTTSGGGENVMTRWNGRVHNFLTFPAILCQTQSAQGSHDPQRTLLSMPRLQEVVTEHAQSCQTLAFPVPLL